MHGVPNMADELGAMGVKRGDDVTFTGDWSSNVERGLALARSNPLASFFLPVLKSPVKGWAGSTTVMCGFDGQLGCQGDRQQHCRQGRCPAMGKPMPKGDPA